MPTSTENALGSRYFLENPEKNIKINLGITNDIFGSGIDIFPILQTLFDQISTLTTDVNNLTIAVNALDSDTVAPIITNFNVNGNTANNLPLNFEINEDATVYMVILPSGSATPEANQIRNGQDVNGSNALVAYSFNVTTAHQSSNYDISALTENDYDVAIVAVDTANNVSSILSGSFTILNQVLVSIYREQIGNRTVVTGDRTQSGEHKIIGVDPFPAGVTMSGDIITISGNNVVFTGWTGPVKSIFVTGTGNEIGDITFTNASSINSLNSPSIIDVFYTADDTYIHHITCSGSNDYGDLAAFLNMRIEPGTSGPNLNAAKRLICEYCDISGLPRDYFKTTGFDTTIRFNRLDEPQNYPAGTEAYNTGTTYNIGDYALADGGNGGDYLIASRTNGNTNNTVPAIRQENTHWTTYDPHCDLITTFVSGIGGTLFFCNWIKWTTAANAVGFTNLYRLVRNTEDGSPMVGIKIIGNYTEPNFGGFHSIAIGDLTDPPEFRHNEISEGLASWGTNANNSPIIWDSNVDFNGDPVPPLINSTVETTAEPTVNGSVIVTPPNPTITELKVGVVSQSEPSNAMFQTGAYYRQQSFPTLRPTVDAEVIYRRWNEGRTTTEHVVIDNTAITAGKVNPGLVGALNLWDVATNSVPIRLGDLTDPGTSIDTMMDNDTPVDTGGSGQRTAADDIAVSNEMVSQFGGVDEVLVSWWNSVAASAKTLWASQSAHYVGLNADGSDYDFTTGSLEHCLVDPTGRGYGIFPDTTKISMTLPGTAVDRPTGTSAAISTYENHNLNYVTRSDGSPIYGMQDQNSYPSVDQRELFMNNIPEAIRGSTGVSPAAVRFGDYSGGSQQSGGETVIHAAQLHQDGQILFAQDLMAQLLVSNGFASVPFVDRFEEGPNGSYLDMVISLNTGESLHTLAAHRSEPFPALPRPHQHEGGMGFEIIRVSDSLLRPIFRTDSGASYNDNHKASIVIHNSGYDNAGNHEAIIRITPVNAFVTGDQIWFGDDGGYGQFILSGVPDYDARLYKYCLRAYNSALDDGTSFSYPGIAVKPQERYTITNGGISAPSSLSPLLTEASLWQPSSEITVSGDGNAVFSNATVQYSEALFTDYLNGSFATNSGNFEVSFDATANATEDKIIWVEFQDRSGAISAINVPVTILASSTQNYTAIINGWAGATLTRIRLVDRSGNADYTISNLITTQL